MARLREPDLFGDRQRVVASPEARRVVVANTEPETAGIVLDDQRRRLHDGHRGDVDGGRVTS
jgi:hypothetical protein